MMKDEIKNSPDKLSSEEYWDSVLSGAKLPRVNRHKHYYITMEFLDSVLSTEGKKTFMEVGAGSSGWLPYFAQKYGYIVSGLDYSDVGCKLARENLRILNLKYDEILCLDLFDWKGDKKYDIIFSYGVIEHFEEPEVVIRIFREHLNNDGVIITLIPNLCGLMGALSKLFVPEIYKIHKVISLEELTELHLKNGFNDIKTNYAGMFLLSVIPWERSEHFLFKAGSLQRSLNLFLIKLFNKLITMIDRFLGLQVRSRYFSPYIISIMRKA